MNKKGKKDACFQVAARRPLVHCITNYVTAQDVANMILACGASPIMADELQEVAQITAASDALVLNLGTLQERTVASMRSAAQAANEKGIPIVLDPVGIGASTFRGRTSLPLLSRTRFAVIRGNYAELAFLTGEEDCGRGVDSIEDRKKETAQAEKTQKAVTTARLLARQYDCVAVLTGAIDVITDGDRTVLVSNGVPQMRRVTGTGCMLSGVIGAYIGANEDIFGATVSAVAAMGIAGELSWERNGKTGLGSFRVGLFDAMGQMEDATLAQRGKLQELKQTKGNRRERKKERKKRTIWKKASRR